jgi:hypothetical protein
MKESELLAAFITLLLSEEYLSTFGVSLKYPLDETTTF